jgi:hypothetical protein
MPILKIILDICLLRGRAQDLPASMNLVWLTAAASVAVNVLGMPEQVPDLAQLLFIASQVALFGAGVWLLLRLRGFPARWVQTMTALYAVDAVFSLLLLPFLPALMEMVKQGPEVRPGWEAYVLVVLSGWLLLIIARVLREATEWPLPLAFLAGFATLLAVRIVGHLLAPLFGLMVGV